MLNRLAFWRKPTPPAPMATYRILMTRENGDTMPLDEYRRSFQSDLARAVGGATDIDDTTLSNAFAVAATAYACSTYRATTAAGIPLKVVDPRGDDVPDAPLVYFLKQAPSLLADTVRSLDLWGRAYLRKRYNSSGYPTGLEWVNPLLVEEMPGRDGQLAYYDIQQIALMGSGKRERVEANQVIYIENFDARPDGNGLSKFEAAWRSISVEQGIVTYAAAFFVNNADISGFLSFDTPLNEAQYEDAKKNWRQFKSARNAHRTAVMPAGTRWNAISAAPKDLAMPELDDKQVKKICAVMEVDPTLVGLEATSDPLGASSTYQQVEVSHIRRVSLPLLNMLILPALNEQWAHRDFDRRDTYTLEADENNIAALTESNLLKSETAINLTSGNILDYEEGRELLGYEPREDYIKRDPKQASQLWNDGVITLNQYRKLVGLDIDVDMMDMVKVDGVGPVPISELRKIWRYRLLVAPSVFNTPEITGEPLPQPTDPTSVVPTDTGGEPVVTLPALPGKSNKIPFQLPAPQPTRAMRDPLRIGIAFGDNQFVRYCKRALSEYLTAQNIRAEWVDEQAWCLPLATVATWTPNAAAALIRSSDYSDTRKIDMRTGGYAQQGRVIGVAINGDLTALMQSVRMDMEGADLTPEGGLEPFIPLCTVDNASALDFDALPPSDYPLVGNNVTLYRGDEAYHQWPLRGVSLARSKELDNWRHVIARKGREYAFTPEVLRGTPVAMLIADALAADVEIDDVFDVADAVLRGEFHLRDYGDTRASFVDALTDLVMAGMQDEVNRRRFGTVMRALLRRLGTQAFQDGKRDAGNNAPLTENDLIQVRAWNQEQSQYVTHFANEIFKEGLSNIEVANRSYMWADVSLSKAYTLGVVAGGNPNMKRILGQVQTEHCPECIVLAGQVHPASEWAERDLLIGTSLTTCKTGCQCSLVITDEPEQGNWL